MTHYNIFLPQLRQISCENMSSLSTYLQVSIPLGLHDDLPVSVSLLAKHGSDGLLLNLVETLYDTLKEQVGNLGLLTRL